MYEITLEYNILAKKDMIAKMFYLSSHIELKYIFFKLPILFTKNYTKRF